MKTPCRADSPLRRRARSPHPALALAFVALLTAALYAQFPPVAPPGRSPASQPATRPGEFQPGLRIDWAASAVRAEARIVLREGPLEFFACFPGREHESILRLECRAMHLYMALGLVGLAPGRPPAWDPVQNAYLPPEGALVDIEIEYSDETGGAPRRATPALWLRSRATGRPPLDRPWLFCGSVPLPGGALASDRSGAGVALVDFPDNLLCLPRSHSSDNAELWAEARTGAIPPEGTTVTLVFRAARPRTVTCVLDWRGAAWVDGRLVDWPDAVEQMHLAQRIQPDYRPILRIDGALRSDVRRFEAALRAAGVQAAAAP